MKRVVVGTRGTPLALIQTREVVDKLREKRPDVEFEVKVLRTAGDRAADAPLRSLGVGIFVKEIEEALLRGEVDMAVHSHKDLLPVLAPGLTVGAVTERLDPRDALVNRWNSEAGRPARRGQNWHKQPSTCCPVEAMGAPCQRPACAGERGHPYREGHQRRLRRSGAGGGGDDSVGRGGEVSSQYLPADKFVPPPGQGALAVEVRSDDHATSWMLRSIDHTLTRRAVMAEMAFLERLGSGCQEPSAAYARVAGETMVMQVFLASEDGEQSYYTKARGRASNPHELAMEAVQQLIERGAGALVPGSGR